MPRERSLCVALAATLALCACRGPDEISLGGAVASSTDHFLSPTGIDDALYGTRERPWKTFAFALGKLKPGSTLTLLDGTYDVSTTGTLNVRCGDATPGTPAPNAVLASPGAAGMPIAVTADHERAAFIDGDGSVPPVSIDGCQYWAIRGLHVGAQDKDEPEPGGVTDTGSVVVLVGANQNLTLSRLLLRHPNLYKRADLLRIADDASFVTVEECELYDFHHDAIAASRSRSLVFQRNYINSRDTKDLPDPGHYLSDDPDRGDHGVVLEETSTVYVENNIVEGVSVGFAVVGRAKEVPATVPVHPLGQNYLLGNIVDEPATIGFRLDSRCDGQSACDDAHTLRHTTLDNDVVIKGVLGVSDAGSVLTTINELTTLDTARGVDITKEMANTNIAATDTIMNTLFFGFQSVALSVALSETNWGCDHCATDGGYTPTGAYYPDDAARVTNKVTVAPGLGTCLVYMPMGSPLQTAGSAGVPVGANVVHRYDDGGSPIGDALWDNSGFTGCGKVVAGVNDDAATNCTGLNQPTRLNVGTPAPTGCPLP